MSFGPSAAEKTAQQNQQQIGTTAVANSTNATNQGNNLLSTGGSNVASGTNFFNTLLNGNQANTTALLAPSINQIQGQNNSAIQALSTLMPRGGGRSGSLFSASYAPEAQISNLFNGARSGAAGNLANIGLQQQSQGSNLFGIGNQALGTGLNANQDVSQNALAQRQYSNSMWSQLGSGLFNLATTPFGGGAATNGLLGLFGKGSGGGGGGGSVWGSGGSYGDG